MNAITERVALFCPSLRGGGAERVMVNLASGFIERGLGVDLVLVKAEGPYLANVPPQVRIVDLGARRLVSSLPRLIRYLRSEKPVAMLSTQTGANVLALWCRRLSMASTRVVVRETNSHNPSSLNRHGARSRLLPRLMRHFYPWADGIIAVSHGAAKSLARIAELDLDRIQVIYSPVVRSELYEGSINSINHAWFAPGEPPVVLSAGRLTMQKDFATLIRAFALLRDKVDARLVILGEGEQRAQLESLIQELALQDRVSLPGFVNNPYPYMARAAVYVLSSMWEGLPNALIEAMALGAPVVATDCESGPREILQGGQFGKLVPVGDAHGLSVGMLQSIQNSEFSGSRADALAPFSQTVCVDAYLQALRRESLSHAHLSSTRTRSA